MGSDGTLRRNSAKSAAPILVRSPEVAPRLFRVIVPVHDITRAAEFYEALLGMGGSRVSPGRHYIDAGGVILALYDPTADGDRSTPKANFEHLYFAVRDLEAIYRRAERLGGLSGPRRCRPANGSDR
jgi:predicted enzyme related to lactoylglutathione lyase